MNTGKNRGHDSACLHPSCTVRLLMIAASLWLCALTPLVAQDVELSLQQCIEAALADGIDASEIELAFQRDRLQYEQTFAKNGLSLKTNGSATHSDDLYQAQPSPTQPDSLVGTNTLQAGLSLSGPSTRADLSASQRLQEGNPMGNSTVVSLSVTQTIWDGFLGGSAWASTEQARILFEADSVAYQNSIAELEYRIQQAYYAVLADQRILSLRQGVLQQREEELNRTDLLYESEQVTQLDLLQAQIHLGNAQLDLMAAQSNLTSTRAELAALMGKPTDFLFFVAETEPVSLPETDVDRAVQIAYENRTDLALLELNLASGELSLALAQTTRMPTVSLNGSLSLGQDWTASTSFSGWNVGLQISAPLFDGGLAQQQIESARLHNEIIRMQISDLKQGIRVEVQRAIDMLQQAQLRLELAAQSRLLAEKKHELNTTKLEQGSVSWLDTLTTSVTLATARVSEQKTTNDLDLATLSFDRTLGYPRGGER